MRLGGDEANLRNSSVAGMVLCKSFSQREESHTEKCLDLCRATGWILAMTLPTRFSVEKSQAFSLVELLVVISVIAIIAAIALPTIANATDRGNSSKAARNAQSLCSLIASARSAGATNQWTTVDSAIDDLQGGITVKVGAQDVNFNIPAFSPQERSEMMPFLAMQTNSATVSYVGPSDL